jgi:predicted RNA-binding protein with PIN domain
MPYIIDGHNLIGKMPDIHLDDLDDEAMLIDRLEVYFKSIRKKAIIFFDRGQPGEKNHTSLAFVQVHFVHQPGIADNAIVNFLRRQGGEARNYTVVSSDNAVRSASEKMGARLIRSRDFIKILGGKKKAMSGKTNASDNDVDFWLKIFQDGL